ncbi:MAG: hypothetical protein IPI30_11035 [Saprospiraceae bacterium]|nr:hypothetical protein [Candidatus Vicinibacter affinis]
MLTIYTISIFIVTCTKDQSVDNSELIDFSKLTNEQVIEKTAIKDASIIEELEYMRQNNIICPKKFNELHNSGIVKFTPTEVDDYLYPFLMCGTNDIGVTRGTIRNQINDLKALKEQGSLDERKHRKYKYMYASAGGTILVREHLALPQAWKNATAEACAAWNALGFKVKFSGYCSSNNNYLANEIDVAYDYVVGGTGNTVAWTQPISSSGKFSEKILVHKGYTGSELSAEVKRLAMVHEIGHAIGLMHTDTNDAEQVPNVVCAGANKTDPFSVMKQSGSKWLGFSSCDKQVIDFYW